MFLTLCRIDSLYLDLFQCKVLIPSMVRELTSRKPLGSQREEKVEGMEAWATGAVLEVVAEAKGEVVGGEQAGVVLAQLGEAVRTNRGEVIKSNIVSNFKSSFLIKSL